MHINHLGCFQVCIFFLFGKQEKNISLLETRKASTNKVLSLLLGVTFPVHLQRLCVVLGLGF